MSATVIDARPDRYLRELREHGNSAKACEKSGISSKELDEMCQQNPRFDLTVTECHLEFIEDAAMSAVRDRLAQAKAIAMQGFRQRHPESVQGGDHG